MSFFQFSLSRLSGFCAVLGLVMTNASPALSDVDAGGYLAARQAERSDDFVAAARYFDRAWAADQTFDPLQRQALRARIALGDWTGAAAAADNSADPLAQLARQVDAIAAQRWQAVLRALDDGAGMGPLVDDLIGAWAHMAVGDHAAGMKIFDQMLAPPPLQTFALRHQAFALAQMGEFDAAAQKLSRLTNTRHASPEAVIAQAQILSQTGRNDAAIALLDREFGQQPDASITAVVTALRSGAPLRYTALPSPEAALSDLFLTIAAVMEDDAGPAAALIYARAALHLAPANATAILKTASLLEDIGQYELAEAVFALVPADDPAYPQAALGRAQVLVAAGQPRRALGVLDRLGDTAPDLAEVHVSKGDTLRQLGAYEAARGAYDQALARFQPGDPALWFVHYLRGITSHQLDDWPAAEADLRMALRLRPDQPQVLNYLGYTLVERGENLDEAQTMIERAVAARPDNGAIVDSLGWVLFQLGQYNEAVPHLERAAALLPVDPVINDHLGDALWAVGRRQEARFHWRRALSFGPTPADAARIRSKLADGLDLVLLHEHTGKPLRLARGAD